MTASKIDPRLLEIMRCPVSHQPLKQVGDWLVSTDDQTRLRYPIRDGIPVMLPEEAEEMDEAAWQESMKQ